MKRFSRSVVVLAVPFASLVGLFTPSVAANTTPTWHVVHVPIKVQRFSAIFCTSALSCDTSSFNNATDVSTSDGGATWQNAPGATSQTGLSSLACVANSECYATASTSNTLDIVADPLGNFGTLSPVYRNPNGDVMSSIACPSTNVCVAAGSNGAASGPGGYIWYSHNLGTKHPTWHTYGVTVLNNQAGGFSSISCPNENTCYALDQLGGAIYKSINGGESFSSIPMSGITTPKLEGMSLLSISCPEVSYHDCVVVGDDLITNHPVIIEPHFKNSKWSLAELSRTTAVLRSVSCATARFCVAVGDHLIMGTSNAGYDWYQYTEPKSGGSLDSVSCPIVSVCYATSVIIPGYSGKVLKLG